MVKVEMHLHTLGMSPCAKVPAKEIPAIYAAHGYQALVVTNHYMKWLLEEYYGGGTVAQKVERYLSGYRAVKAAAEDIGMRAFLGLELNLERYNREIRHPAYEFLIYGVSEDFLREHPMLYELTQEELFDLCQIHGLAMFQAHPFRTRSFLADYRFMHGVEVNNGNPRHDSFNVVAECYCKAHNFLGISGSDFHEYGDENNGGVYFHRPILKNADIPRYLLAQEYTVYTNKYYKY